MTWAIVPRRSADEMSLLNLLTSTSAGRPESRICLVRKFELDYNMPRKSPVTSTTATLVAPAPDGVGARVCGVVYGEKVGLLKKAPASE